MLGSPEEQPQTPRVSATGNDTSNDLSLEEQPQTPRVSATGGHVFEVKYYLTWRTTPLKTRTKRKTRFVQITNHGLANRSDILCDIFYLKIKITICI